MGRAYAAKPLTRQRQQAVAIDMSLDVSRQFVEDALDPVDVDGSEVANREDPVAEHADIGAPSWGPGAVDDGPAAEQQVEGGHRAMVTGRNPTSPNWPCRASIL